MPSTGDARFLQDHFLPGCVISFVISFVVVVVVVVVVANMLFIYDLSNSPSSPSHANFHLPLARSGDAAHASPVVALQPQNRSRDLLMHTVLAR